MSERVKVEVGQVWEDCDPRTNRRRVRVEAVSGDGLTYGTARVVVVDRAGRKAGRVSRILVKRMYPHSTGFRLVEDAADAKPDRIQDMIRAADANVERQREKEELLHEAMDELANLDPLVTIALWNEAKGRMDELRARYAALYPEGARK